MVWLPWSKSQILGPRNKFGATFYGIWTTLLRSLWSNTVCCLSRLAYFCPFRHAHWNRLFKGSRPEWNFIPDHLRSIFCNLRVQSLSRILETQQGKAGWLNRVIVGNVSTLGSPMSSLGPTHAAPWDLNQKCFHAMKYLKLTATAVSVFPPKLFWR